jgi:hypothetical protein
MIDRTLERVHRHLRLLLGQPLLAPPAGQWDDQRRPQRPRLMEQLHVLRLEAHVRLIAEERDQEEFRLPHADPLASPRRLSRRACRRVYVSGASSRMIASSSGVTFTSTAPLRIDTVASSCRSVP